MAYERFSKITGDTEQPMGTWMYKADTEADIANLPDECAAVLVLEPDSGKKKVRIKNTSGVWKEV